MAMRYLGDRFDIHTGGIDNVFPHHEDEIAQSAPFVGGVPANHWVHGEFLLMRGKKMAKSAGNFQRVTELADRGIDPLAFRYLVLTRATRHKLDYSDESIDGGRGGADSLRAGVCARSGRRPTSGPWQRAGPAPGAAAGDRPTGIAAGPLGHGGGADGGSRRSDRAPAAGRPAVRRRAGRFHERFVRRIDDDLDLPTALAVVREILRADLPADERRWLVLDADQVLGLDLDRVWETRPRSRGRRECPADVAALVDERAAARAARDFAACRRAPRRDRGRRAGRSRTAPDGSDRPPPGLVAEAYVGLTRRSRREPNRSMIR